MKHYEPVPLSISVAQELILELLTPNLLMNSRELFLEVDRLYQERGGFPCKARYTFERALYDLSTRKIIFTPKLGFWKLSNTDYD